MIELLMLSYKHRPEPFSNGVYEIDSKRGEIDNQKFPIILLRIWRELFTSVASLDIRNFLMVINSRNGKREMVTIHPWVQIPSGTRIFSESTLFLEFT